MICPECGNVFAIQQAIKVQTTEGELYSSSIDCNRCHAEIEMVIRVRKPGDPILIKQTQQWIHEGRPTH